MSIPTKEELTERAQLVRIHEANCKIEYPTDHERAFRLAIMKKLGAGLSLKELQTFTIVPPGSTVKASR